VRSPLTKRTDVCWHLRSECIFFISLTLVRAIPEARTFFLCRLSMEVPLLFPSHLSFVEFHRCLMSRSTTLCPGDINMLVFPETLSLPTVGRFVLFRLLVAHCVLRSFWYELLTLVYAFSSQAPSTNPPLTTSGQSLILPRNFSNISIFGEIPVPNFPCRSSFPLAKGNCSRALHYF